MKIKLCIFLAFMAICIAQQEREKKLFSIFSVVSFKNDPCQSTSSISSGSTDYRNGTCRTTDECSDKGGSIKGTCASGFGVCCVHIIDDDDDTDVNHNDTYIQNPNFPSAYDEDNDINYKVNKVSDDICFLRLDFEQFQTNYVDATGVCQDFLEIATQSGINYPNLCGTLTGQHMYVVMGPDGSDTVDLKMTIGSTDLNANKWEIKVAQVPCNSMYSPPEGCTQWFTGATGQIRSLNFAGGEIIPSLNYNTCLRQEAGFCCTEYTVCDSSTDTFQLGTATTAKVGSDCGMDYVYIEGAGGSKNSIVGPNKFCGAVLNFDMAATTINEPIIDCTGPFQVGVFSDATDDNDAGFCLHYRQLPC